MRFRLWHVVVFLVALAVFAILRAPAWVAPQREGVFTYTHAHGTIWSARYQGVRVGPYSVSEVMANASVSRLLLGELAMSAQFRGGDIEGEAMLSRSFGGSRAISSPALRIEGLPLTPALALRGETLVRDLDIAFASGTCARASGEVTSTALQNAAGVLGAAGPLLAGSAVCEGEAAVIALTGSAASGDTADVRLRLLADGGGEWRVGWKSANANAIRALGAAGFTTDGAEEASLSGRMTWSPF